MFQRLPTRVSVTTRALGISAPILVTGLFLSLSAPAAPAAGRLSVVIGGDSAGSPVQELKSWSVDELQASKMTTCRERDPQNGRLCEWKGVGLDRLLNEAMAGLSAEKKSQIDLVVLTGESGEKALVPRAFVKKYPLLVAVSRERAGLGEQGPFYSVAPVSAFSKPKNGQDTLPVEVFFMPKLAKIELSNYRARFGSLFLKRRTDPAAMRGEKLFTQNCVACHGAGRGPALEEIIAHSEKARALASTQHPSVKGVGMGMLQLAERDRRALLSYLDTLKAESAPAGVTAAAKAP